MTYSVELQNALDAMRKITKHRHACIGPQYNPHITFPGKVNSRGVVVGDTIVWEYGGLKKTGKVVKVNRKTIEVVNTGATPFGATRTVDKSTIVGKVSAHEFKVAAHNGTRY